MTLMDAVAGHLEFTARKHDLGADYVEREVNGWSQYEFLQKLSEGIEELQEQHAARPRIEDAS